MALEWGTTFHDGGTSMDGKALPTFGNWQAVEVLVGGAQAFAYRAVDVRSVGRNVFIKWFVGDLPEERFTREVEALTRIERHIGLPQIRDQGKRDGHPWIAMEFEEGVNLAVFSSLNSELSASTWLRIAIYLTGALRNAHEAGILHRDIKPANIMIDEADRTTLVDFGLAVIDDRHSQTNHGDFLGTLAFIAPEGLQEALTLTDKSDVFSLAATLIYLAYGGMPPAVRALGPLANEGWGEAANALPDAWMRDVLWEAIATDPTSRPTAEKLLKRIFDIPHESVAALGGITAAQARRVGSTIADFAQDRADWRRVRDWLLFAHEMGDPAGADYLARIVESQDGVEASLPYWRHYATQRPVIGNLMLYRAIRENPSTTTSELDDAKALLHQAGEDGGYTSGQRTLGYEFLALGDYSNALRAFGPLGGADYHAAALCRHRLGLPSTTAPTLPPMGRWMAWTSMARVCKKMGRNNDAEWLEAQAREQRRLPDEGRAPVRI